MGVRGGMPVGADGRIHGVFTHNPSTLRLSMQSPSLQTIPRGSDSIEAMVKQMFVAPAGSSFWACDYSGIEAVLVGYFAGSKEYTRLAKLGVHAYFAATVLGRAPSLDLPDAELRAILQEIKREDKTLYACAKQTVHMSNYLGTPFTMFRNYPEVFGTQKNAARYQKMYFELFPAIRHWHVSLCRQVDGSGFVRNPFGYVHRFFRVLAWSKDSGEWTWDYGEDAKRLIAFLPQSTAAAILKRAGMRLFYDRPEVGKTMRLFIHDEILGEAQDDQIPALMQVVQEEMERPIPELPLDPTWEMGEYLTIGTEGKVGKSWATMEPWEGVWDTE